MGSFVGESVPKLHAVCVPYPAQGHVGPMLKLAQLLHNTLGFHITFVNNHHNHARILHLTHGIPSFRFEAIPDGIPPSDPDATQDILALSNAVLHNKLLEPFKKLIGRLNDDESSPPVSVIVSDVIMSFTIDAGEQLGGIPVVLFWSASACGYLAYSQSRTLLDMGVLPFKDSKFEKDGRLDIVVDWVPSMNGIQLKHLPSFIRTTNKDDIMFNFLMISCERATKSRLPVIVNTFDAFESDVLDDIYKLVCPNLMYTIGPLQLLDPKHSTDTKTSIGTSLWKEDSKCLEWLDSHDPNSVIYVSFGSITTMTRENLVEFAWGLANSNRPFLWIIRHGMVSSKDGVLPQEFLDETKERSLLVGWCDQEKVLAHISVGVFLTHCGWNSTLDTVCGGVPVLCWPFFAEQQTNCWFLSEKWGMGTEIDNDVTREKVAEQIPEMMEGEKGKEMKRKALEWKGLAEEATASPSGSSYLNYEKFMKQVILPLKH